MQKHICVILSGAKNPFPSSFCVTERYKDGGCGFFGLWPQNDGGRRTRSKPISFSLPEKKRFLGSKEKGAFEIWGAVRCSAAAPIFTSPLCAGPGRYGLCGRHRVSLCHSERSEESVFPVFVRDRKGMGREIRILRPYGLRMTGMGVVLLCVGRDVVLAKSAPLKTPWRAFLAPLPCSSSPHATRFAGLAWGP